MKNPEITVYKKITDASEIPARVTLADIADPLLNIDHNQRITLTLDKKQCGTIVPLVLYMAMKLRYMSDHDLRQEPEDLDKTINSILRQCLMDIRRSGESIPEETYYGKTLQEKMFRYLVLNEILFMQPGEMVLFSDKKNKAHTVSNGTVQGENPSFTVPCYLCRYLLEMEGLNPGTDFTNINPSLKAHAKEVYSVLSGYERDTWSKDASFSRRVQNRITLVALSKVFSAEEMKTELKHPYY